jgi:TolB protein
LDGQQQTPLTDLEGVNWGPYWHPQLPYIIWSGADHSNPTARPNYDLWLAKYVIADGKFSFETPQRVTDFAGADVLPVFSPSGKQLMWTSTRTADQTSQLFIADFQWKK